MLKRSFSHRRKEKSQDYCHICGEVNFADDLRRVHLGRKFKDSILLCGECYVKVPNYIPNEQERRWYDGVRKKNIQSDDQNRKEGDVG